MGVCYYMRRFPVGYQSGQLGRTVNPLALPSYVRIVDPPPFFARGFGHGLFVFPTLFLHENTKGRKGLGTSPFGPAGLSTVPIPCVSVGFLEKQANRRCRSVPTGRLTKPLAPHSPIGTSQTCRGCRGSWKFGSLDAWMLGSLVSLHNDCFVARLPRALFSVFCGRGRFPPLQSTNPFVSFVSFVIEKHSGSPACGSTSPVSVPLCLLCELCVLRNLRFLLPPQRTVRLGGKRVRRTGVVKEKRTRNWVASLGTVMV